MNALNLTLILILCSIASLSQATPRATQPQAIQSSKLNQTQKQINIEDCRYTAIVKTSCSSTHVRGQIDLLFGDDFGNQVEVPKLNGPFEACTANAYDIYAPCISEICHIHVYMIGDAGWVLESVSLDNNIHDPVIFFYNTLIPVGAPFGFDYCGGY